MNARTVVGTCFLGLVCGASLLVTGCEGTSNSIITDPPPGVRPPDPRVYPPVKTIPHGDGYEYWIWPYDGEDYWLYDTQSRKWKIIKKSSVVSPARESSHDGDNNFQGPDNPPGDDPLSIPDFDLTRLAVEFLNTPYPATQPPSGASAEQLLASVGLSNATIGVPVAFSGLKISGSVLENNVLVGSLDVTIPFSSAMSFPNPARYPLAHEMYTVVSSNPNAPNYWVVRVSGHAHYVGAYLIDCGIQSVQLPESLGSHVVTTNAATRAIYVDGVYSGTVPSIP